MPKYFSFKFNQIWPISSNHKQNIVNSEQEYIQIKVGLQMMWV